MTPTISVLKRRLIKSLKHRMSTLDYRCSSRSTIKLSLPRYLPTRLFTYRRLGALVMLGAPVMHWSSTDYCDVYAVDNIAAVYGSSPGVSGVFLSSRSGRAVFDGIDCATHSWLSLLGDILSNQTRRRYYR